MSLFRLATRNQRGRKQTRFLGRASGIGLFAVPASAEFGFDERYERDYNIFNPINELRPDNPLNPINSVDPNNPFNPINEFNPDNPLNPINRSNPNTPFALLNRPPRGNR